MNDQDVRDFDYKESRKFLKGLAFGIGLSALIFWGPLIWWLW